MSTSHLLRGAFLLVVASMAAGAQEKLGWHSIVEANGSMLFGAASQTLATATSVVSHVGENFTADASLKFRYGESEDEQRVKFVSARGWAATASADFTPNSQFVPFFFAASEASLEKRISNRSLGGVGAKYVFAKSNTGSASISLAILGERTSAVSDSTIPVESVARWSWRIKTDHKVHERLSLSHVTFYAPVVNKISEYTITSTSVGAYSMTKSVAFTVTFTDNYDAQARLRGAPSNNDGAFLFGVRSTF